MNSNTLAIVYEWGIVKGIDLRDKASGGKVAFAIDVRTSDDEIRCDETIAASPDGRFLAVGRDTAFKIIDLRTKPRESSLFLRARVGRGTCGLAGRNRACCTGIDWIHLAENEISDAEKRRS